MHAQDLLSRTLRSPSLIARFSMGEWDVLVRQARAAGLLARLAYVFRQQACDNEIPPAIRWHFEAAETLASKQQIAVRWELEQLRRALADLKVSPIVLKGAAYVAAGLPACEGRLFNDIDILVPREHLGEAESLLILSGWHATDLSEYDKRYYRRWMHEIPPLQHIQRESVVDLHHAILPDTARYHPDSAKLRSRAVPLGEAPGLYVLAVEDLILHSATHLFHDGELPHGLRDLSDLDLLIRDGAQQDGFWHRLTTRADELQLGRPLFYALRYVRYFLNTPIPDDVGHQLLASIPNRALLGLMDRIFTRALAPMHVSCDDGFTPAARMAAYIRAHWLRMPPHLLIPHLFHKAFVSPFTNAEAPRPA